MIPAWMVEIITQRAAALGITFDEALAASLDIDTPDALAQIAGWAHARGCPIERLTVATHYSRRSVEDAIIRYQRARLPSPHDLP